MFANSLYHGLLMVQTILFPVKKKNILSIKSKSGLWFIGFKAGDMIVIKSELLHHHDL